MDLWVLGSEAAPFLNSLLRESNIQDLCELKGRSLRGGNQIVREVVFFPHNFPRGAEALSHPCAVHSIPCKSGSGHLLRSRDPVAPSLGFWGQLQQLWVHSDGPWGSSHPQGHPSPLSQLNPGGRQCPLAALIQHSCSSHYR